MSILFDFHISHLQVKKITGLLAQAYNDRFHQNIKRAIIITLLTPYIQVFCWKDLLSF